MKKVFPKLYAITDRLMSGLSHAEQVRRLCQGGIRLAQLREKHLSPREFFDEAQAALRVARDYDCTLIINDRVDIALATGAGGVHLGQNDIPPSSARKVLGSSRLIGYSTHTPEQMQAATSLPIDYIAYGPIFNTRSKEDPDKLVGLEGLRSACEVMTDLPVVAIGGISISNALDVIDAGAGSLAVISALLCVPDEIEACTREFLKTVGN